MENKNNNEDNAKEERIKVEEKPKKNIFKERAENAWDLIKFAIIAFIIVMPIRMFIAQPFIVSGDSMFPTFHDGEYLIVDEISYIIGDPNRNDVIIFRYPNDPSRFFIKRVIGLPNEEIIIKNGVIDVINKENPTGLRVEQPYLKEKFDINGSYKTGNKEYFVMGDNRNQSLDSRIWGALPDKLVTGRAFLRLLPLKSISYLPGLSLMNK